MKRKIKMKRLISLVLALSLILVIAASLVSCSESDVPPGMQLVRGGEEVGYYFYCPDEWIIANDGDVSVCYVSKLDPTSVLFTEATMPEEGLEAYFEKEAINLKATFAEFTLEKKLDKEVLFGDAQHAYKSIYTYKYDGKSFRTMLIYVVHNGRFFIFTYTAQLVAKNGSESAYDYYLDEVQKILDSFKIVEKKATGGDQISYVRDNDGYLLISNKAECGFDLYVPEGYTVDNATGFVSASHSDGASISVTKPTYTGVTAENYWTKRKADLEALNIEITEIQIGVQTEIPGTKWAFLYEYEQELLGEKMHVYQLLIVVGNDGYVFTYSAPDGVYDAHLGEALTVLSKIGY